MNSPDARNATHFASLSRARLLGLTLAILGTTLASCSETNTVTEGIPAGGDTAATSPETTPQSPGGSETTSPPGSSGTAGATTTPGPANPTPAAGGIGGMPAMVPTETLPPEAAGGSAGAVATGGSAGMPSEPPMQEPPTSARNVVLILIDDINHYGITAYGANRISAGEQLSITEFETPNIDQLAREGFVAGQAFSYPICENTRVSLMSGKGNQRNYLGPKVLHESDITFGDVFQRAGFKTGLFGKWKQTRGTKEIPGEKYLFQFGWDQYTAFDTFTEGNRFINPNLAVNGEINDYTNRQDMDPETGRRWYGPDIANRDALAFIDKHKDERFFLYYPMMLIHDPHLPTPDTKPDSDFDNVDPKSNNLAYLPDMIEYTDALIGKVVKKLDDLKLREDTLIVVVGDNGTTGAATHHLADDSIYRGAKGEDADNGIHVPLIVNQPKAIPASQGDPANYYQGMVHIADIYPTLMAAAGVDVPNPDDLDGVSFWPQATGTTTAFTREHLYQWSIGNFRYDTAGKVIAYAFDRNFKRYAPTPEWPEGRFFDLRTDLFEKEGEARDFQTQCCRQVQHAGLDLTKLTAEQQTAYERLGKVIEDNQIVPIQSLNVAASQTTLAQGEKLQVQAELTPKNTTRNGVIWESSNPNIVGVDKFGELTALAKGTATINVYSWSDAEPAGNPKHPEYKTTGVKASLNVTVQ